MSSLIAAAVVSGFLASAAQAQTPDDKNLAASIDRAAAAAVAGGESPGLEVAVVKDGRAVLVKSYGSANLEQHVPVSNDSVFRIGSVTKQFTAVALLLLAEEGKVSLQDKLSKYYPNFPRANDITLDEMLHHTSGIYNYTSEPNFAVDGMIRRSTDEMVEFIGKLPKLQDFEPGTNWSYSNSAYFILGGVVEKASGEPLATVFKTRFFTPLGMTHSALDDETEIVSGRASGYSGAAPGKFTNAAFISMSIPGGAGSVRSTASDLATWNAALFGGKILKAASLTAMLTPGKLNSGENSSAAMARMMAAAGAPAAAVSAKKEYGYALFLSQDEGHRKIDHGGGIYGFSASLSEFPDDKTTVVVLSNAIGKDVGASKIADRIERLAIGLPAKK
ncbi:MAG TPA: serine hydrolase domain-containing protein [Steroidobacteraceae bacterium]|nr:serine hydrolase domain-containing protein [Steroidobacteraceae bacterium]